MAISSRIARSNRQRPPDRRPTRPQLTFAGRSALATSRSRGRRSKAGIEREGPRAEAPPGREWSVDGDMRREVTDGGFFSHSEIKSPTASCPPPHPAAVDLRLRERYPGGTSGEVPHVGADRG